MADNRLTKDETVALKQMLLVACNSLDYSQISRLVGRFNKLTDESVAKLIEKHNN